MKNTLKAIAAGVGCTPMVAAGLLIAGLLLGEIFSIKIKLFIPPQWLLFPAGMFPVCFGMFMRAYTQQARMPNWLQSWRGLWYRQKVGYRRNRLTVEEYWVQNQLHYAFPKHRLGRVLDDVSLWGVAAFITFLPLACLSLWYGLTIAG